MINLPLNPLIPAKAGIQINKNARALLALYSLDIQSLLGMSGFYGETK